MSAANCSGPNGPVLAAFATPSVAAPPHVTKSQHAPPPCRKTTTSVLASAPQLIASPVGLVENWYALGAPPVASVQSESGNGIQVQPVAPAIGAPSVRAMAAPSGGGEVNGSAGASFEPFPHAASARTARARSRRGTSGIPHD